MRGHGHENGLIPQPEIDARAVPAVIYREYLDSGYLIPKPDKLIAADINEPPYTHRVPGTVIYTRPCQRLKIHVRSEERRVGKEWSSRWLAYRSMGVDTGE